MTDRRRCLVYGAYGYTGELIAAEAVRRGLQPILAGRRAEPLAELGQRLELEHRVFDLEDPVAVQSALAGLSAVVHCAGPFVRTSRPMVDACLAARVHYLDITGEIGVFESIFRRDERARESDIVLLPGVGLDVVPTDCLAAHLARGLPGATHLALAIATNRGSASRGTLATMIEALPAIGAERVDGKIVPRPAAFATRRIDFPHRTLETMAIPWGDLATAYRSTGIPNIRVFMAAPPRRIRQLRRLERLLPLLGSAPVKRLIQGWIRHTVTGPARPVRESARTYFWGSVHDAEGRCHAATLEAPEGYTLTARTAIECLKRVLAGDVGPGAATPATAFGPDFIKGFEGVVASW